MFKVRLSHLQNIIRVRKKDITPLTVFRHKLVFTLLECFQLGKIIALYPAGFVKTERLPTALCIVFI